MNNLFSATITTHEQIKDLCKRLHRLSLPPPGIQIIIKKVAEQHSRIQRNKLEGMIRSAGKHFGLNTEYEIMQFREIVLAQTAFTDKQETVVMGVKIMKRISTAELTKQQMLDLIESVQQILIEANVPEKNLMAE